MPDQLLNLLELFLLVLLYLFFLRVLRTVWTEVNAGRGRGRRAGKARAEGRAPAAPPAVEPPPAQGASSRLGQGRSPSPVHEEITLGRAAGCQVPLEDAYASQVLPGVPAWRALVRRGPRVDHGTYLNRRRVAGPW